MAKLEDRGSRGLPPPPAPPRQGANPWKLSDTARKREAPPPREEDTAAQLLEELLSGKPGETASPGPPPPREPSPQGPSNPWKSRRRPGFLPLLVLLIIAGVIVKIALGARETGEWRELIPALFVIAFIAHGWWRSRRRRETQGREDGET
ncbi:MAG TPA: hypothetical protein VH856_04065 [Steroidobacteraceae bacterium]|jgi:hypothetical protein